MTTPAASLAAARSAVRAKRTAPTTFTRDELSLLLYFESQAVDYGGKLQSAKMNAADLKIAKRWNANSFVRFGRIAASDISTKRDTHTLFPFTHWCVLSDAAWAAAQAERRARCERLMAKLTVTRTGYDPRD